MAPAAPGGLRQSAAGRKGVVSAGLHFFNGYYGSVPVPQSLIDHPLVTILYLGLDAHMEYCEI